MMRQMRENTKLIMWVSAFAFVGLMVGSFAHDTFNLPCISVYFWVLLAVALKPKAIAATP